jgi:hypothetical protein
MTTDMCALSFYKLLLIRTLPPHLNARWQLAFDQPQPEYSSILFMIQIQIIQVFTVVVMNVII